MRGSKYQSHGNKVEDKALGRMMEEHNLSVVLVEDWMLIQRANFDLRVDEEPYHSLQVYANLGARRFMVRVWGKTICSGEVTSIKELNSLCADYFKSRVACVGHLGSHPGATGNQGCRSSLVSRVSRFVRIHDNEMRDRFDRGGDFMSCQVPN